MKRGTIFHKLRNSTTVGRQKEQKNNDKTNENELKSMLTYCVIKNYKTKLKEILLETIAMRRLLFKKDDSDFKEFWKFYFIDTDLVR